jgi:MFS family permease
MRHHFLIKKSSALYTISVLSFFLSLHIALPTYFNSSFLSSLTSESNLSLIYSIQAIITIVGLLLMHNVLRKFGNYKTAMGLIVLQIFIFYGIVNFANPSIVIPLFILALSIVNLIGFTFDIFLEENTDVDHTGSVRGRYMTVTNSAWILGPLLGGMLIAGISYRNIYIAAFALLFPLVYIIHKNFYNFVDPHYPKISLAKTLGDLFRNHDISKLMIINTVLQVFYAWMTIYTPIYLNKVIGFTWGEIGIIFTIMLIPFILIETPLGKLADKKLGEKELMIAGYIIMGVTTILLSFVVEKNIALWAMILFITRIGAAAAEIMIETYFFKKVDRKDSEILGVFRVTRPMAYLIAPLITSVGLLFTSDPYLFAILGGLCLVTLIPIAMIRDTA